MKDNGPVSFYTYDRSTKEATFLFVHRPELEDYTLAPMEPMSFQSRDGLTIHGYITYPPGSEHRDLPMVLNVHGGPWARDGWGYNPEAQWLSNRGYVCLQVNFRGSTGYGKEFLNAGDKEWGGTMHNDLVDAVNWAIDQGIADPERVCIYGASYGGYAALVGATFTPDLFCCAVPMMGPSNLMTFIETIPPYWSTMIEMMYKRVGDPRTEQESPRGALAALQGRRNEDPDAHRAGRERSERRAGRVGPVRGGNARQRPRDRVHRVRGRGARVCEAGEQAEVLRGCGSIPGSSSGRSF